MQKVKRRGPSPEGKHRTEESGVKTKRKGLEGKNNYSASNSTSAGLRYIFSRPILAEFRTPISSSFCR
jgi:hypothetical protein